MARKSCYIFFISSWLITLLVTGLIINIFFGSLVNDKFSDLKLNIFIITGFICSKKYVKQVALINHSWISPILQRGLGLEFYLFSKKWGNGGGYIFLQKKERLVK